MVRRAAVAIGVGGARMGAGMDTRSLVEAKSYLKYDAQLIVIMLVAATTTV